MAGKRTTLLQVRMIPDEKRAIRSRAEENGLPTSTYMRELALASVPPPRPHPISDVFLRELAQLGDEVNRLARAANANRHVEDSRPLWRALVAVVEAVRQLR